MELIVAWLYSKGLKFIWLYHFYAIVEYTLLCIYFIQVISLRYRLLVVYSIILFVLASASISYWYYHYKYFPGANINTEGVLICVICTYVLMNLDIHLFNAIHKHPDFWISLGLLIFFVGTFFSNGLYTYLSGMNRDLANRLFDIINKPLNLILYSCFIIGFICAIPRKSTLRLF